jgi:hypothetical protein
VVAKLELILTEEDIVEAADGLDLDIVVLIVAFTDNDVDPAVVYLGGVYLETVQRVRILPDLQVV